MNSDDRTLHEGYCQQYLLTLMKNKMVNQAEEDMELEYSPEMAALYTAEDAVATIQQNCTPLFSRIARFGLRHKDTINKIPFLRGIAIRTKKRMLNNAQSGDPGDLSALLSGSIYQFIYDVYTTLLHREPDAKGAVNYKNALCAGMPREAMIYSIIRSEEYASTHGSVSKDPNVIAYRKIYRRYLVKRRIKKLPLIGWAYSIASNVYHIPSFVTEMRIMDADQREREQELKGLVRSLMETVTAQVACSNETATAVAELDRKVYEMRGETDDTSKVIRRNQLASKAKLDQIGSTITSITETLEQIVDAAHEARELRDELQSHVAEARKIGEDLHACAQENVDTILSQVSQVSRVLFDRQLKLEVRRESLFLLNAGISPTLGLEHMQADQIRALNEQQEEATVFTELPVEAIAARCSDKAVVIGYCSDLIAQSAHLPSLQSLPPSLDSLNSLTERTDVVLISNPALAALVLTTPPLLQRVTKQIRRHFVFIARLSDQPVTACWENFYATEAVDGRIWKWADGTRRVAAIQLYNTTMDVLNVQLWWESLALCGHGQLLATCNGMAVSVDLTGTHQQLQLNCILKPGRNTLMFEFDGESCAPEKGARILSFLIDGFRCDVGGHIVKPDVLYRKENPAILNMCYIRNTLHKTGFYTIRAELQANHGHCRQELGETKYTYPDQYRYSDDRCDEHTDLVSGIVLVDAYRLDLER